MTAYEEFCDAIDRTTGRPVRNGKAHCPCHDDNTPSLSISEGDDGRVLLTCHAGCATGSIVAAVGFEMRHLFPDAASNGTPSEIVGAYDYVDEGGTLLFQAIRFRPKTFRQRRPDGNGGWAWSLNGTRRVLYRLPKVIEAARAGRVVFIVEGEKDADALEEIGLTATTNPMGAGKWRDEYVSYLEGAYVAIIPDNDVPGREHAERVARSVHGTAESVRIVPLPGLKPKGDVSDWIAGGGTREALEGLVREAEPYDADDPSAIFWYEDGDAVKIDQSALIDWLESEGVCKIFEFDRETSTKVRRRGRVLERFPHERIQVLVDEYLRERDDPRALEAMRRGCRVYLGSDKLGMVRAVEPSFQRSTRDAAHYYYANGFVAVTEDDIHRRPYDELEGYVWRDWISDRRIDLSTDSDDWLDCEFGRFLRLVTGDDEARLRSLVSAAGYLLHTFKDPSVTRAIVITDEAVSDDPAGGTGKGLFASALGHVVASTEIDARRLNLESQFALQSIVPGVTRIAHFNDAGSRFQFDRLFPAVTDAVTVERKGQQPVIIPFSDAPKFVITTNEVLRGKGGSHERRVFEIEFAPYFDAAHTPEDEFGHLLFYDWNDAEWSRFDRLMLYAVQYYLKHGLETYRHVNLEWKRFVANTSREFGDFVKTFEFDANPRATHAPDHKRYDKGALIRAFIDEHRVDVTPHTFTRWLAAYADYRGWELINRLGSNRSEIAFIDYESE